MTTFETLTPDPVVWATAFNDTVVVVGLLLCVAIALGVGLWLLSFREEAESLDAERAERWYTNARQLDEYRQFAYHTERNRERRR